MPTSKHWVIPNTIPYASPSLKILYFDMYPHTGHPVWGAYHFRLSLFVFDEVAENADLEVVTKQTVSFLLD